MLTNAKSRTQCTHLYFRLRFVALKTHIPASPSHASKAVVFRPSFSSKQIIYPTLPKRSKRSTLAAYTAHIQHHPHNIYIGRFDCGLLRVVTRSAHYYTWPFIPHIPYACSRRSRNWCLYLVVGAGGRLKPRGRQNKRISH